MNFAIILRAHGGAEVLIGEDEIMFRQLRAIAFSLALVLLAAGAAQAWPAAGPRAVQVAPGESFFILVWNRLVSLIRPEAPAPQGDPGAVQQKAGCSMDPNGQPLLICDH